MSWQHDIELIEKLANLAKSKEIKNTLLELKKISSLQVEIAFVGKEGVGKTSVINALLGNNYLPIDLSVEKNKLTLIRQSKEASFELVVKDKKEKYTLADYSLKEFIDNKQNISSWKKANNLNLFVDNELLKERYIFLDVPSNTNIAKVRKKLSYTHLEKIYGAIILLSLTDPIETRYINELKKYVIQDNSARVIFAFNQADNISEDYDRNEIKHRNIRLIEKTFNIVNPNVVLISAKEALQAKFNNNKKLYEIIGYAEFENMIKKILLDKDVNSIIDECFKYYLDNIRNITEQIETIDTEKTEKDLNLDDLTVLMNEPVKMPRYVSSGGLFGVAGLAGVGGFGKMSLLDKLASPLAYISMKLFSSKNKKEVKKKINNK